MREFGLVTLRTFPHGHRDQRIVRTALSGPCLGVTSLWIRHLDPNLFDGR